MRLQLLLLFVLCLVTPSPSLRADASRDVTIDDYFSLASVPEFAVSPQGDLVAYCDARWQQSTDDRKADLWVVTTGGQPQARRLTCDRANDRSLKWSSDGTVLYFLGNRKHEGDTKPPFDGTSQVWRIEVAGGSPQPVTRVEGGVTHFDLSRDERVWYSVDAIATDDDGFTKQRSQFSGLEYGHGKRTVSEIWRLDLSTWRADKLVSDKRYVREFAVSRDGKRLAMITAFDDSVLKSEGESRVDVWEEGRISTPPTEAYRARAATPHAWLESLVWSADGGKFAFCAIFDAYPAELVVGTASDSGWKVELASRPSSIHVRGYGTPLKWHPQGQLFFVAECESRSTVAPADAGVLEEMARQSMPDRVVYGFDIAESGTLGVYAAADSSHFVELFVSDFKPGAVMRRVTTLNPQASSWKLPSIRHITWKGVNGVPVGGVLELPTDYKSGTRIPLVVGLHGGPTTSVKGALEFDPYLGRVWLPARGYAVLCPNYRGSTGYGDSFVTDLVGRENDIEVGDILAGIRSMIDSGIADPRAIGVMGWSNGGYLTNCLIARPDQKISLRAASSGAGILDTVMEWGINDEPAYPRVFKTGLPWEKPDTYRATSPIYGLGNVTTPTLIHVGGDDVRCPPAHSRMLYRALREYLRVPTELVVYPGEPHGLGRYSSRKAKMEWDVAWFENYLKAKP